MELFLRRDTPTAKSQPGELVFNGKHLAWTIERPPTDPEHPCISTGRFQLVRYDEGKHGPNTPLLVGVPGRSFIEIHPANFAIPQLLGCIAPGRERGVDAVWQSQDSYHLDVLPLIVAAWDRGEEVWITVQ